MTHHEPAHIARPTIAEALKEFLAAQRPRLAARTFTHYEHVIELLEDCLNGYAHQSLGESERSLFERLYDAEGPEHHEFCEIFGPGHILPNVGEFLGYFMVRKVIAGKDTLRAAGTVTKKLARWLAEKGYAKAEDAAEAAERGGAAVRNLPKAEELADLLRGLAEEQGRGDEEREIEDHFTVIRIEPGRLWLEGMLDGRAVGPINVPREVTRRCQVGWSISGVVGRAGKTWRIVEAWNVYPS
jgi:hypothetical protein